MPMSTLDQVLEKMTDSEYQQMCKKSHVQEHQGNKLYVRQKDTTNCPCCRNNDGKHPQDVARKDRKKQAQEGKTTHE